MRLPSAPDPGDEGGLLDACGESPHPLCRFVWDNTHNDAVAGVADWFVAKPLTIVLILVGAWILTHVARRAIKRSAYRVVMVDPGVTGAQLRRLAPRRRATQAPPDLDVLLRDPRRHARATSISTVLGSTVTVALWTVALLLILGELDIDLAPLIASAGIAGVALGFGAQSLVKDCLSGLFMVIEDQFGIGDVIDLGEAQGTVEKVTLRATTVRGADGTLWHVPNGIVQRVGNKSQAWAIAVLDVVVAYGTELASATELIRDAANEVSESDEFASTIVEAPDVLGVEAMTGDGITLRLTVKTLPGAQLALQRALRQRIKETLDANDIEIAVPRPGPWIRPQGDPGGAGSGMS